MIVLGTAKYCQPPFGVNSTGAPSLPPTPLSTTLTGLAAPTTFTAPEKTTVWPTVSPANVLPADW